jgi:hypothetical protein
MGLCHPQLIDAMRDLVGTRDFGLKTLKERIGTFERHAVAFELIMRRPTLYKPPRLLMSSAELVEEWLQLFAPGAPHMGPSELGSPTDRVGLKTQASIATHGAIGAFSVIVNTCYVAHPAHKLIGKVVGPALEMTINGRAVRHYYSQFLRAHAQGFISQRGDTDRG